MVVVMGLWRDYPQNLFVMLILGAEGLLTEAVKVINKAKLSIDYIRKIIQLSAFSAYNINRY